MSTPAARSAPIIAVAIAIPAAAPLLNVPGGFFLEPLPVGELGAVAVLMALLAVGFVVVMAANSPDTGWPASYEVGKIVVHGTTVEDAQSDPEIGTMADPLIVAPGVSAVVRYVVHENINVEAVSGAGVVIGVVSDELVVDVGGVVIGVVSDELVVDVGGVLGEGVFDGVVVDDGGVDGEGVPDEGLF